MGATNRSTLGYVAEVTAGTTPSNPAFKALRFTSSGLKFDPTRIESNEIRADRQLTDTILVDAQAGGDVGFELSFSAFDDMIEAALQGTWQSKPTIVNVTADTEISDVSATTLTVASGGTAFKAGHLCLTNGFSTSANNDILSRVSSSTGTTIVFPSSSFTAEASVPVGARVRVVGFEGASADLVATTTGGNALTSTALDFTTLGLNVGEWVKIGGDSASSQFATAANNGWCRVSAIAATRLSFDAVPAGWGANSGTGKTIRVFTGDFLKNGTTQRNFTFERQQQDIASPSYELYKGQQVNRITLNMRPAQIITGTLGLLGQTATVSTSRAAGATDVAAAAYGVLNTSSNVGRLVEGGAVVSGPSYFTEVNVELNNNLERQQAIGTLGAVGVRNGQLSVGGALNAYFGDIALLQKVLNDTESSLSFRSNRSDGYREAILIDLPRVKITGASDIPGKNQDRFFQGNFTALRHAVLGHMIAWHRYWYLPVATG